MTPVFTLKSFDELLFRDLRDPEAAAIYLQDAWEDSQEEFLVALRKYIQANGGMRQCAIQAHLSREALYRMLSEKGNPEVRSLRAILEANGLTLTIAPSNVDRSTERNTEQVAA